MKFIIFMFYVLILLDLNKISRLGKQINQFNELLAEQWLNLKRINAQPINLIKIYAKYNYSVLNDKDESEKILSQ